MDVPLSTHSGNKKYTEPVWKTYAQMEYYLIYLQETGRESVVCIRLARITDMWRAIVNEVMGHQAKKKIHRMLTT
jgi:hypothetical protein